jgi:hypothetical protein
MALGGKREGAGRKKGYAAIQAEKTRELICKALEKDIKPIIVKAIKQAKDGDPVARSFLFERGYGKVAQAIVTEDENGEHQPITGMVITIDGNTI